jgi:D-3-phosphoglycerate dehydrogenase
MKNKTLILDFDSTFIQTEGLDDLAEIALRNHPQREERVEKIRQMTAAGMEGRISLRDGLAGRLELLQANRQHIGELVDRLHGKVSHSFRKNASFLKQFADQIYIVSGGFREYIVPVVTAFGIREDHIFANSFEFDEQGNITGLDSDNPLSQNQGKVQIVKQLNLAGEILVMGDGMTDYEIRESHAAHVFFAFVENVNRPAIVARADHVLENFDAFLQMQSYPRPVLRQDAVRILLLENIHPNGIQLLRDEGYSVETVKGSLSEEDLCNRIRDVNILGIRSKTMVTQNVLEQAESLIAIGAFCIGTNQIDLKAATAKGVCIFNAPYSNTRSVVEMVIGEIIMLMRKVIAKNADLHQGKWNKSAEQCYEVRGKKLGIVGYGNIGSQLSVIAESLGMQVYYYDLVEKLQLGNAKKCNSLEELLEIADIVTLHVDGRIQNAHMIGREQFQQMKPNVVFINLSRGHVVDIDALVEALDSGKISGAAIDVFPEEPESNQDLFVSPLRGYSNVILSPHIGGSTEEAQLNIGEFLARRIISYMNTGDTTQSVNLPEIQLPAIRNAHRLIHLHANVPGILAQINQVLASHNVNLLGQYLKTNDQIGYVISDVNMGYDERLHDKFHQIKHTIKSRVLY